jgi:hypothetical protein
MASDVRLELIERARAAIEDESNLCRTVSDPHAAEASGSSGRGQ